MYTKSSVNINLTILMPSLISFLSLAIITMLHMGHYRMVLPAIFVLLNEKQPIIQSMCLCQSVYLSNCPKPLSVGIDQRDRCVGILSDSQHVCEHGSICFLVRTLSKASLSQNRSKGPLCGT